MQDLSDDEDWCLEDGDAEEGAAGGHDTETEERHSSFEKRKGQEGGDAIRGDPGADDYYMVLGVDKNADAKAVKKAYRREGKGPRIWQERHSFENWKKRNSYADGCMRCYLLQAMLV